MIWIWTLAFLSCILSVYSQENETIGCVSLFGYGGYCTLQNLKMKTAKSINYTDIDEVKNKVTIIIIEYGNFKELPEKLFLNYKNVINLIIYDCGVTEITSDSFKSATYLQNLEIVANKIVSLNSNIFSDCGNLTMLNLVDGLIESINSDVFQPLLKLKFLDLSRNRIKSVEKVIFPNLQSLYLRGNQLEEFNGNYLNVSKIYLNNNSLKSLNINGNCKVIYAEHNKLSEITIEDTNVLEGAYLDDNSLTDLKNISKCTKLVSLQLSKNNIQVKLDTFSALSNLTRLDISGNNQTIDDLGFLKPMQSLIYLDVQQGALINYSLENVLKIVPSIKRVQLMGDILQTDYNPLHPIPIFKTRQSI